jgi:FkbM family methyltransferase
MYFVDRFFLKKPRVRSFVTRIIEGDREHDVQLFGESIRVHLIREHGYLRSARLANSSALLRDELPILINLAALMAPGDTFVDIGANVGIYSLTLARLGNVLPETHFYAFEANPDTFARLETKAQVLGVNCSNIAISDCNGVLEFVPGAVSHVFTTLDNQSEYSFSTTAISVQCARLDQVDILGNSIIIKIDVEGQEKEVLAGASGLFRQDRVKAVYLDGYKDLCINQMLLDYGFVLRDGVSLKPASGGTFRLLATRNSV